MEKGKPTKTMKVKMSELYLKEAEAPAALAAAEDNPGKKVVKSEGEHLSYHRLQGFKQLAGLQTPTKHSKDDI